MIEFNIQNGKLVIDPVTLTVSAFNDIWNYDKSTTHKKDACNMLVYVYHMADMRPNNPFRDFSEREKDTASRRNAFGKSEHKFTVDEQLLIDRAIAWYGELNNNDVMRFARGISNKMDQMTDFMNDPANKIETSEDMDRQAKYMGQFKNLLATKKAADDHVKDEMAKMKVKGGSDRSPLQSGMIGYKPKGAAKIE